MLQLLCNQINDAWSPSVIQRVWPALSLNPQGEAVLSVFRTGRGSETTGKKSSCPFLLCFQLTAMGPKIWLSSETFGETWTLTLMSAVRFEEERTQCCYIGKRSLMKTVVSRRHFLVLVWNLHVINRRDETGLTSNASCTLIVLFPVFYNVLYMSCQKNNNSVNLFTPDKCSHNEFN